MDSLVRVPPEAESRLALAVIASSRPGLGTSIVWALAEQLNATVDRAAAEPGTAVFIVHA